MFWQKRTNDNKLNSSEYDYLTKRIIELFERVEYINNKTKAIEADIDNLRTNIIKKLKTARKEESDDLIQNEKELNNPVILPYNGTFR